MPKSTRMIYLPVHRGACSRDYEDFLRVPVRFTDGMAAIRFAAADLRVGPGTRQQERLTALEAEARAFRADDCEWSDTQLVAVTERIIEGMMALDTISFTDAARTLGLPPRTMQRRLAMLGLSFDSLLESRRRERSLQYLANPSLRVTDVAMMLGYTDAANFTRAFHRWHRQSPVSYRLSTIQHQASSRVGAK
jgi:AraC-like DNA-binding protein